MAILVHSDTPAPPMDYVGDYIQGKRQPEPPKGNEPNLLIVMIICVVMALYLLWLN